MVFLEGLMDLWMIWLKKFDYKELDLNFVKINVIFEEML